MDLNLREDCAHALLVPTSMGVRLTADRRQPTHCSSHFTMHVTSAETNVVSPVAFLGLPVKILTALVEGSPIARMISDDLARRRIAVEAKSVDPGGAWGWRHQINIADSGYGARGPRVYNDRAGEVGRTLTAADFDLERIFGAEGVKIVHLSGLFAALSPETAALCEQVARVAKSHGSVVSFDLNYRASFWRGREQELATSFAAIAQQADILVGNEEDFQLALGLAGPEAGGKDLAGKMESFRGMIGAAQRAYPKAQLFATTLREVVNANEHLWGAILYADDWYVAEPRSIGVLDRIGGGDGFVGGMLYGLLRGWEPQRCLQFGWATGALAASSLTDYAQPADEAEVWSIWDGDARVKR